MTLLQPQLLAHLAGAFPDRIAWKNLGDGTELSLGSWHARSNQLARGLLERDLQPGDRVAIALDHDEPLEWLISYMAVHRAGGVAVPLNTRLSGPETRRVLEHAEVTALLVGPDVLARLPDVASLIGTIACTGMADHPGLHWSALLHPDATDIGLALSELDVADIMYTSGATGAPKGVVVQHGGLSTIDRVPAAWHGLGFISASPFSTTSGSLLICGPMRGGLSGWFLPRFDPTHWLDVVARDRPVAGFLVPAMVELIVSDPHFASADLSSLAVLNIGSAPIASETLIRLHAQAPTTDVMCGYGMTEFGAVTAMPMGDGGRHRGSVGVPLPGVEVRILDPDGHELGVGEVGQISVRGARPPRTYFREPVATSAAWQDGWLQSGDLGSVDEDGFLWVTGRQKEMIIRGGHNIAPGEVEAVLFEHPAVAEAAVAGIPHEVLGEDVAAWVVLTSGAALTHRALRAFALERLADYKVPRRITFVDALPWNEAGKVLKAQLALDDQERSGS